MVAGEKGLHELEVLADFVDVAGASGIVAGRLDTAGKTVLALEPDHVVGLPAMQGDLLLLEFSDGFVGVYADGGIALFGDLVRLEDLRFVHCGEKLGFVVI